MQFYQDATKLILGILLSGGITLAVKWLGDRSSKRATDLKEAISIHDTMLNCHNEMDRTQDFINNVSIVINSFCDRYDADGIVNKSDVQALRDELLKRPSLNSQKDK